MSRNDWPGLSPSIIESLLAEDVPDTDLTTSALGIGHEPGRMTFRARGAMTVAGIEIAAALIARAGADVSVETASGRLASAGTVLLSATGEAAALHKSWKAAQTLTEILSGIATATRSLVDAVEAANPKIRVACTRKTVPGARRLSLMAIRAGGAIPHRLGLSDTILVFPEHQAFLSGVSLQDLVARLRHEAPEKKLAIETATFYEARDAIEAGFDTIQLREDVVRRSSGRREGRAVGRKRGAYCRSRRDHARKRRELRRGRSGAYRVFLALHRKASGRGRDPIAGTGD